MNCEYCQITLSDITECRRHMLTAAHDRQKRNHELSTTKFVEMERQKAIHPRNFHSLTKLLNLHSAKDVDALFEMGFFQINSHSELSLTRNLINVIGQSVSEYHLLDLPPEIQQPFIRVMEQHNDDSD